MERDMRRFQHSVYRQRLPVSAVVSAEQMLTSFCCDEQPVSNALDALIRGAYS
jgi:hypothetical protein